MGSDLGDLIKTEKISFDHLLNKTIAVDAMKPVWQLRSIDYVTDVVDR